MRRQDQEQPVPDPAFTLFAFICVHLWLVLHWLLGKRAGTEMQDVLFLHHVNAPLLSRFVFGLLKTEGSVQASRRRKGADRPEKNGLIATASAERQRLAQK